MLPSAVAGEAGVSTKSEKMEKLELELDNGLSFWYNSHATTIIRSERMLPGGSVRLIHRAEAHRGIPLFVGDELAGDVAEHGHSVRYGPESRA